MPIYGKRNIWQAGQSEKNPVRLFEGKTQACQETQIKTRNDHGKPGECCSQGEEALSLSQGGGWT